jgi:hypothetical protein
MRAIPLLLLVLLGPVAVQAHDDRGKTRAPVIGGAGPPPTTVQPSYTPPYSGYGEDRRYEPPSEYSGYRREGPPSPDRSGPSHWRGHREPPNWRGYKCR